MQTASLHLLEEPSAPVRTLGKLKAFRLGRLGRLLIRGRDLHFIEKIKLNYYPSHRPLKIGFGGRTLQIADAESFLGAYKEIFLDRVYAFPSASVCPVIIDGGANIGLATLFFKRIYPQSRILAFEPDPFIFEMLRQNIAAFRLEDVKTINAALWNSATSLSFTCEGGASGHIATSTETANCTLVTAVQLKSWLREKIDFLKLDIEGAEYEVLEDCREDLKNVENLFVEYHSPATSEQKLSQVLEILSGAGFRYHIHPAFTSPHPFLKRRLLGQMDLQLNISAFRPLKNGVGSSS